MPRIALLDVDMTLVDNKTSYYNEGLFNYLSDQKFDVSPQHVILKAA
jgi:hypothetical protein